ncbi:MAG: hypothetical protein ACREBR_00470, partial [bacterium]
MDLLRELIEVFNQSCIPIVEESLPTYETTCSPFFKLITLFEALVCGPSGPTEKGNWGKLIDRRLEAFRSANIQPMFTRANLTRVAPPQDRAQLPDRHQREQAASIFANLDNPGKAFRIVTATQPVALLTPPVVSALQDLYPDECSFSSAERSSRSDTSSKDYLQSADPFIVKQLLDPKNIQDSLRRVKRGGAAGGLTDSPDMLVSLFLSQSDDHTQNISDVNIALFSSIVSQVLENKLTKEANVFFTSNRLIALHKSPVDDLKLRPIAIGSALRRLVCGHISRVHRPYFAKFLAPYQWGIGVPNGMEFIYHTTKRLVDRYVSRSEEEMRTNPPTRALLQLDLRNMFNSVSRKKARQMIRLHFPQLLGLFDLMYLLPAQVWFQLPNGEWNNFLQIEGFPQGCPLSPFFAALVLHCILLPLDTELRSRASNRLYNGDPGDDGFGSLTDLFAFLDDTSSVVPFGDLLFLLRRFVEMGHPLGCHLAQGKCTILSSTCGVSPRYFLSSDHRYNLDQVLTTYCGGQSGELLYGTRLLGFPLGNQSYVSDFLNKTTTELQTATTTLNNCITCPQLKFILFKSCVQPKIAHLELPDILFTPQPNILAPTDFTTGSFNTTRNFVTTLLYGSDSTRELSPLSILQALQPVGKGGLGLRSTEDSRVGRFLVSTIRSIRHATGDISLPTPTDEDHPPLIITLPSSIQQLFLPGQLSNPKLLTVLNGIKADLHHLPQFQTIPLADLPDHITLQAPLSNLAKQIYRHRITKRLKDHSHLLPISCQVALTSLQNHLATVPLAHMTRRLPSNRLHPADFRTLLGISLCDSVFSELSDSRCFCDHANVDPYGHHFFSCSQIHKTHAHNIVRDALYTIFKEITPYTPTIGDAIVCKEKRGLHRTATRLRPGDVTLHYGDTKTNVYSALIVDVTTLGFTPLSTYLDVSPSIADSVIKHHVVKENDKFKGGRGYTGGSTFVSGADVIESLNHQNFQFVPFTWDAGGTLGPCAHDLLFGSSPSYSKELKSSRLDNSKLHQHGHEALRRTLGKERLTGVLRQADQGWMELNGRKWFKPHYQTTLPSSYAKHTLALAIARARLHLISRVRRKLRLEVLHAEDTENYLNFEDS